MTTVVNQTVKFNAGVESAYQAIADSTEHSAFTGAPKLMSTELGGPLTTHGGAIEGRVLELIPNERIVQVWRVADWPIAGFPKMRPNTSLKVGRIDIGCRWLNISTQINPIRG